MRLPVLRLMMLKRTRWLVLVAEYIATEHDTNDNLRKPFQFGRGAMANSFTRTQDVNAAMITPVPSCGQRNAGRHPLGQSRPAAARVMLIANQALERLRQLPPRARTARVVSSGPKSLVPSIDINSASRVRARLTRDLMVPTAQPQMLAASS